MKNFAFGKKTQEFLSLDNIQLLYLPIIDEAYEICNEKLVKQLNNKNKYFYTFGG